MKNFIETFTTAVLLAIIVFASVALMMAQMEIVTALETKTQLLHAVEESEAASVEDVYQLSEQLNSSVKAAHKDWDVEIKRLESSNSRDYYLVTLKYKITIPLFGTITTGEWKGYADTKY